MLRDIPKVMFLLILIMFITAFSLIWYVTSFDTDAKSLDLTETVLSTALSETDPTSRMYEGVYMVNDTFEQSVVNSLRDNRMKGATIRFDYMFDEADSRFSNVPEFLSTKKYTIGGSEPNIKDMKDITGKPVTAIRVRIDTDGNERWTHTATVDVDIESKLDE